MAEASVEFLLENLKQLLVYNVNLISDVKKVERLYNDLCMLKAFLKDYTEKRSKNEVLKELVKQIRSVVYEAEDVIDSFVTEAAAHKARGVVRKAFYTPAYAEKLRKVGVRIEEIRQRVDGIYKNKQFGFEYLQTGDGAEGSTNMKKPPIVEEDNVVGFEDEAEKVNGLLTGGADELEVISIVGMAGLGKTTLAKIN